VKKKYIFLYSRSVSAYFIPKTMSDKFFIPLQKNPGLSHYLLKFFEVSTGKFQYC